MYIVPGIIGVLLSITMILVTSLAIVRERERGTLEQLIVTPIDKTSLMLGKLVPFVLVGYIQMSVMLLLGRLLFLDEPTAGVDPAARRRFWALIYEFSQRGITILVTTHYMDEAARCGRLAFLSRGHLIAVGTAEEVQAQFGEPTIEDVFIELQRRDEGAVA